MEVLKTKILSNCKKVQFYLCGLGDDSNMQKYNVSSDHQPSRQNLIIKYAKLPKFNITCTSLLHVSKIRKYKAKEKGRKATSKS